MPAEGAEENVSASVSADLRTEAAGRVVRRV